MWPNCFSADTEAIRFQIHYTVLPRYRSADTGTLYNTNTLNALKIKYSTIGTQGIVATALSISVATNVTDPPGLDSDPDSKPNFMKF